MLLSADLERKLHAGVTKATHHLETSNTTVYSANTKYVAACIPGKLLL
jgi:hypothetical protein